MKKIVMLLVFCCIPLFANEETEEELSTDSESIIINFSITNIQDASSNNTNHLLQDQKSISKDSLEKIEVDPKDRHFTWMDYARGAAFVVIALQSPIVINDRATLPLIRKLIW